MESVCSPQGPLAFWLGRGQGIKSRAIDTVYAASPRSRAKCCCCCFFHMRHSFRLQGLKSARSRCHGHFSLPASFSPIHRPFAGSIPPPSAPRTLKEERREEGAKPERGARQTVKRGRRRRCPSYNKNTTASHQPLQPQQHPLWGPHTTRASPNLRAGNVGRGHV